MFDAPFGFAEHFARSLWGRHVDVHFRWVAPPAVRTKRGPPRFMRGGCEIGDPAEPPIQQREIDTIKCIPRLVKLETWCRSGFDLDHWRMLFQTNAFERLRELRVTGDTLSVSKDIGLVCARYTMPPRVRGLFLAVVAEHCPPSVTRIEMVTRGETQINLDRQPDDFADAARSVLAWTMTADWFVAHLLAELLGSPGLPVITTLRLARGHAAFPFHPWPPTFAPLRAHGLRRIVLCEGGDASNKVMSDIAVQMQKALPEESEEQKRCQPLDIRSLCAASGEINGLP